MGLFPFFCVRIAGISRYVSLSLTLLIWLTAIALEIVPFGRAIAVRFIKQYKIFYVYLGFVLMRDICLMAIYFRWYRLYPYAYWGSEAVSVLLGCGLVWEVYVIALAQYPGAARVARNVLAFVFIFAIGRIFVKAWNNPKWIPDATAFEMERDLRTLQGALLLALVLLFGYYAIPLGRNLKGIMTGYGLLLVTSMVNLTLRNHFGDSFQSQWQYIQPACYLAVLGIWCYALWSYAPVPEESEPRLEEHYQALRTRAREGLSSARARILRGIHP